MQQKTSTRILIAFICLVLLVCTRIIANYILQKDILSDVYQIANVENVLDNMSERVVAYDAYLTERVQDAILRAQGKASIEEIALIKKKYDSVGEKFGQLLKKDATLLISQSTRTTSERAESSLHLSQIESFNAKLVDIETRIFALIQKGDVKTAYALIVGDEYQTYKDQISQHYTSWSQLENKVTISIEKRIISNSKLLEYVNILFSILTIVVAIAVLMIVRLYVASYSRRS